jgi:hypothetical protein
VVPIRTPSDVASPLLEDIADGIGSDGEIILAVYGEGLSALKRVRQLAAERQQRSRAAGNDLYLRVVRGDPSDTAISMIDRCAGKMRSPVMVVVPPEMRLTPGWRTAFLTPFGANRVGMVLPAPPGTPAESGIDQTLRYRGPRWCFAARRTVLLELGASDQSEGSVALQLLSSRALALGWEIVFNAPVLTEPFKIPQTSGFDEARLAALVVRAIHRDSTRSPFSSVLASFGQGIRFDTVTLERAEAVLRQS